MNKKSFAVMVKPVGSACNMHCTYCYYLPVKVSHTVMSEETLEKLVVNAIGSSAEKTVSFVWHGGEPTLAGLPFFEKIVELQKKHLPPGYSCWNNLQTNALLLDDEWCRFLVQNRFDVGVSIDGSRAIHDANRLDVHNDSTYARVTENIRRLVRHGKRPDLLCTVNSETERDPLGVYRNLKDLHTGWIQFIPVVNRDPDGSIRPESVSPEGYGNFLKAIFYDWIVHDLGVCNVQLFIELINQLAGGTASVCWLQETCGMVPVVEADGKVYSCDHFVKDSYCIGTIDEPFSDLLEKDFQKAFGEEKARLVEECLSCLYRTYCRGCCPKDRTAGKNYLCEGLKIFYEEAVPWCKRLVELDRQGKAKQVIMKTIREELKEKWSSTGRSEPCPCGSGKKYKQCHGKD